MNEYQPGDGVVANQDAPPTRIADWVMVSSRISAFSFRVYCVLRAMTDIKEAGPRHVTLADLSTLIPDEEPVTTGRLSESLRQLREAGLLAEESRPGKLVIADGSQMPEVAP